MLKTFSNSLKTAAVLAVLGGGAMIAGAMPASADSYRSDCMGNDCVRLQCDDWGNDCVRVGYFHRSERAYAPYHARYVCDADGDDCHWVRTPVYYEDRVWPDDGGYGG